MGKVEGVETLAGTRLAENGGLILHNDEYHGAVFYTALQLAAVRRLRLTYLIPV